MRRRAVRRIRRATEPFQGIEQMSELVRDRALELWVEEVAALTEPDEVVWCDGSDAEWERLTGLLVDGGTFRMRIMTRMGDVALEELGPDGGFVRCLHSVGAPLEPGQGDVPWPCNEEKYIVHLPRDPGDHLLRLRVRRQRAARQEVLRAADRVGDGP